MLLMNMGVGKALASAIKEEELQTAVKKPGRHIFLNQRRREIFSALTLTPSIGLAQLAVRTGIAHNTVEWHLGALVKEDFVSEIRIGRRKVYFPQGLISSEEAEFFFVLNLPRLTGILFKVIEGSGLSQSDISRATGDSRQTVAKALGELERVGLVTKVSDGANTRYYSTTLLPDKAGEFYQHSKDFSDYILKRLVRQGGKDPQIVKKGLDRIIIEAGFSADRFTIEIGVNPYITCTSC